MGNLIGGKGGGGEAKEKEFVRGAIYIYIYDRTKSFETMQTN